MIENYLVHILIIICIYLILAAGLNLAFGYTGLLNWGHVAFFGIGAYTSAILVMNVGVPFVLAFVLSGLVAAIFGVILSIVTREHKSDYLALLTFGFLHIAYNVFQNWTSLTNGTLGISGIPRPEIFGFALKSNFDYLIFTLIITIICILVLYRIVKSPFGKLLGAVRDDELGLKVLGKDTLTIKIKAMFISTFLAGIAGSLLAHYIRFISPKSFLLEELVLMLTIVIVGGVASLKGTIVAAFLIILIPEALRFIELPPEIAWIIGPLRQILYALVLLIILWFEPKGLFGRVNIG